MLRTIKLSVDQVHIDPGSALKHTGTSWQVSPTTNFANTASLIVNQQNDTVNLLTYLFDYDLQPNQPLYVRTRYHFNNGTVSSWSNVIELNSNQVGLKTSSTVVATPTISVNFDYTNTSNGELVVTIDNVALYSGVGKINATSWLLETTDGEMIYELPTSNDILTELRLPISILKGNKAFVATAKVHTNTNAVSNPARAVGVLKSNAITYFVTELKNTLYRNADNYILITEHAEPYTAVDVRVLLPDNSTAVLAENLDPYVAAFSVGNLDINGYYIVQARALTANGKHTPWVEVYRGGVSDYNIRMYAPNVTYVKTDFGFGGYIDFKGMSSQTLAGDEDAVFHIAIPSTDTMEAYRAKGGSVYPINKTFSLPTGGLAPIPTVNTISLYDGNYLIDHSQANVGGNIEVPAFTLTKYNHITKDMAIVKTATRTDERYGTGRTGSAVVTRSNLVYYIPGEIFDAAGKALDLEMRVFDINTMKVVDHIPLPVTGLIHNVALAEDINNDLYMFGGSSAQVPNAAHNQQSANLLNNKIYKYNKATKTWTAVLTVTLANADSYRYKMQTLRNGKILILDTTPDIVGTAVRKSYIYDPVTNTIVATINNNPTKEHIGVTIELKDGDIGIMSSTPEVTETISFLRTTTSALHLQNLAVANSQAVADLVVPVGQTVYIRDPYRYNSITIQGTSLTNTGRLVWIKDNVATDYFYNDLIVTRNMTIPATAVGGPTPTYNKVVVVGDAKLTVL